VSQETTTLFIFHKYVTVPATAKRGLFYSNSTKSKEDIMRRVVVTGMGIVSSIGNNTLEVTTSLHEAKSGIVFAEKYKELGFRSQVHGHPNYDLETVDRRVRRFMGDGAVWNYVAMQQAIADAGLEEKDQKNDRTGIIMGSGGPSTRAIVQAADTTREKGPKRVGPFAVPACMSSTNSATLATPFGIRGVNYSISSACATSAHCIGNAMELIQWGKQDVMFAGGGEELDWTLSVLFDAMGAMSSKYNDSTASRAYDKNRDGFVIAGGAGVLVLEELEHAKARGAKIYAEIVGYGASDGFDMVAPSGEGAMRCMRNALHQAGFGTNRYRQHTDMSWSSACSAGEVDYINTHGTSTPIGDQKEIDAIREVFGKNIPPISSTKSLTGHSLGAAGVQEAIYCLLMMRNNFLCESAHIEELDPAFEHVPIIRKRIDNAKVDIVMSNSFGFGGTNATLIFRRYNG
jgi:3-oxoacyl-[acyl-carrier-protein] synthase-1